MPRGGKRTGAGRKVGSKAKKTQQLLENVTRSGLTPLEFLLEVMRDAEVPRDERIDAAKAAAPYVHSKMPMALVTPPPPGGPVGEDDNEILNRYIDGLHDEADEE